MITLVFSELRVTAVADNPVLILREADGPRRLAVWISAAAGNAILSTLEDADEDHPSTHDLMVATLEVLDAVVEAVHITGVDDGVFSAHIVVAGFDVTARVSDAITLALRQEAPILIEEDLMDEVAVHPDGGPTPRRGGRPEGEAQLEEFRAFLESINPEDFGPPRQQP